MCASFLDIAPTVLAASRCGALINTYGINLLAHRDRDKAVPFRLGIYSRKNLYAAIARKK